MHNEINIDRLVFTALKKLNKLDEAFKINFFNMT